MARIKVGEKAIKTRNLIFGLRDARVAALLSPYGFSSAALEEGHNLVMKVVELQLKGRAAQIVDAPNIVAKADEFEGHWLPIVKIVLERPYPQIAKELYSNIVRVDGKDAATTTVVFLERLDAMERGEAPYGEEGPKAREYLRTRGLTDAVIAAAQHNVDRIQVVATPRVFVAPVAPEEEAAAVKAMWDWYLEWSRLARQVIQDGNLLKMLGFKKPGRRKARSSAVVVSDERVLPASSDDDVDHVKALPAHAKADTGAQAAE